MLAAQILKTLKYFDIQEHPLTLLEISKYLLQPEQRRSAPASLSAILSVVENELKGQLQNRRGFYFLAGRAEIAEKRWQNNFYATARLKRAKRYLPFTRHIPFVAAVALSGSEAINNSKQGSDIDLLVLAEKNRIWLARILISLYFQLLGLRRHGGKIENRFCLNHYIERAKSLNADKNIYTAVEYVSLLPYHGATAIYDFQMKNLIWIREYLAQPQLVKYPAQAGSWFKIFVEQALDNFIGDALEQLAGKIQQRRIQMQQHIVIAADELSFHPGSKGKQVLEKFFL